MVQNNLKIQKFHPRHWSFTIRLTLAIVLLVILTLSSVTIIVNRIVQITLTQQIGENFEAKAESLSDLVKVFFFEGVSQIQVLALSPDIKNALVARNESYMGNIQEIQVEIQAIDDLWLAAADDDPLIVSIINPDYATNSVAYQLTNFLESFTDQSEVFVTDRYGATVGATGRLSDYYQADETWWQATWNEGQGAVYISDPQFDESAGVMAFLVAVPIYNDEDEVIGILRSTLILNKLFNLISPLEFGETGYALLLNKSGQIIFDPTTKSGTPVEFPPDLRQHFVNQDTQTGVDFNRQGNQILFSYLTIAHEDEGGDKINRLEGQIINAINNLGWIIVVQQELEEAIAGINRVGRVTFIAGIIAVIGVSLLALFLAKVLTRPLLTLTTAAEEIGAGNLGAPLPPINSNDVIGRLTASFKQMEINLRQLFTTLEQQVEKRTAELARATDEAQEARTAAEQSNQIKSGFLANMSHELRTPLNGILGYTQILKQEQSLTERQVHAVDVIHQSGEHLLTLLNDILDLSKIEADQMEIHLSEFHFPTFLKSIVDINHIRAAQKGLIFKYEVLSDLPVGIEADEKCLRQVLINLLGNAVKFTETGSVTFKVGYNYDKIRLQIEDTGVGIDSKHLGEIFSPFQQVGSQGGKAEGTGLGLAISRRLVEMMDANLEVKSTLGQGSTFWFDVDLPAAKGWVDKTQTVGSSIVGVKGEAGHKILIVDDKEANRSLLLNMLTPLGFELQEAVDGQDALAKAKTFQPAMILMDLKMPLMNGFETTKAIRQISAFEGVIIIAISASAFGEDEQKSLEAGCDAFVTKPIRFEVLFQHIQTHLKLEWIYADLDNQRPFALSQAEILDEQINLPPDEAAKLYEMAMKGDVKGIKQHLAQLEQMDIAYQSIVVEIGWLAKRYRIKQIRQLLKPYLEDEKNGQ